MEIKRKKILYWIFWTLAAVMAVKYWQITMLIALSCLSIAAFGLLHPTSMPPHRKGNTPDEEWDDYEYERFDRINARRRRQRLIEAQKIKSKSDRFERIKERRDTFYD